MKSSVVRLEALKAEEKAEIDLHGLSVEEADIRLTECLNSLPKTARALFVCHGYSRGTALKKMVQNCWHWRVLEKRAGLNPGCTWLILK